MRQPFTTSASTLCAGAISLKSWSASRKRPGGFSGFSKSKVRLDAKLSKSGLNMPPWGLHDLRRTFSTRLHDVGIDPIVIEALLAHKQQGVAAVYNRASFREAKKAALQRWHEIVAAILRAL